MAVKSQKIIADLETTVTPDDVRAWAVGAWDIDKNEKAFESNNLDDFMEWLSNKNTKCWFHNLKFDGEFLLSWLLHHGFKYSELSLDRTFNTLITDDGLFYSISVTFRRLTDRKFYKVIFYDSLKKLPFKVSVIATAFELEDRKLKIDYKAPRPIGHQLTEEESHYLMNDVKIVAQALKIQMDKGLTKMTNASDAMSSYQKILGGREAFRKWFPELPLWLDAEIRRAYKGGFTYLNPKHKNRRGLKGLTLDVNSLYPWTMYTKLLPYGYPVYFEGAYEPDEKYPLYIIHLKCRFRLKENHIPCIQLKNNRRYVETEYLTTSEDGDGIDEPVEMYLTSVDYELFKDHYIIEDETLINGYKFKAAHGMFKDYIDYWMHIKETTTGAMRQLAKLMLNSLYGKFATNPIGYKKVPYLDEFGIVRYEVIDSEKKAEKHGVKTPEPREPMYTAMGCFITAYAREKTIRSAQTVYDRFIYADTDSLHLIGYEIPEGLEIHSTHLGAWKHEGEFDDSSYIRAKTYMETMKKQKPASLKNYASLLTHPHTAYIFRNGEIIDYGHTIVTCAGMPENVKLDVTYENFKSGSVFDGKLIPKRYKGGVVLTDYTFTIK